MTTFRFPSQSPPRSVGGLPETGPLAASRRDSIGTVWRPNGTGWLLSECAPANAFSAGRWRLRFFWRSVWALPVGRFGTPMQPQVIPPGPTDFAASHGPKNPPSPEHKKLRRNRWCDPPQRYEELVFAMAVKHRRQARVNRQPQHSGAGPQSIDGTPRGRRPKTLPAHAIAAGGL